jgi:hypothetical protein
MQSSSQGQIAPVGVRGGRYGPHISWVPHIPMGHIYPLLGVCTAQGTSFSWSLWMVALIPPNPLSAQVCQPWLLGLGLEPTATYSTSWPRDLLGWLTCG